MKKTLLRNLLLCCLFALPAGFLSAAPDSNAKKQTVVTADRMSYDQKLNLIFFEENVKVSHPEYTMTARKMTVVMKDKNKGKGSGVEKITAVGDVVLINKGVDKHGKKIDREAKAKEAVYLDDEKKIILSGDAAVRDGSNNMWGRKITVWIKENRMECDPARLVIEDTDSLTEVSGKGK